MGEFIVGQIVKIKESAPESLNSLKGIEFVVVGIDTTWWDNSGSTDQIYMLRTPSIPDAGIENVMGMYLEYADEDDVVIQNGKLIPSIYAIRKLGVDYCKTGGSEHYKAGQDNIEPIEYAIQNMIFEDFAITNIIKYASRFKNGRNKNDLKKVADYAHILCGVEIMKED